ncbi:unnamed protein product [Mytilus coruscus]|uniref:Uncharacterized protein n=1 Tax=Mytilus coruscus TaxID=42192 RepID=A0A6J8A5K3_MYTCO|nr:unnamed protein product [Mytilus coruscus]
MNTVDKENEKIVVSSPNSGAVGKDDDKLVDRHTVVKEDDKILPHTPNSDVEGVEDYKLIEMNTVDTEDDNNPPPTPNRGAEGVDDDRLLGLASVNEEDRKIPPQTSKSGTEGVNENTSIDLHGSKNQMKREKRDECDDERKFVDVTPPTNPAIGQPSNSKTRESSCNINNIFHPIHEETLTKEGI